MNQILSVEMNTNKNTTKKTYSSKTSNTIDIKKILIFFGIALILVGLTLAIVNGINTSNTISNNTPVQYTEPEVLFANDISDDETEVTINHDKAITSLKYNWNDLEEINVSTYNRSSVVQTIPIPDGTNTLTLKITDESGYTTTASKTFVKEDINIKFSFTILGKTLKIKTEDSNEMAYISYMWNSDNSTKNVVNMAETAEDKKVLEAEIEIPKGKNTLTVTATNKKGQSKTKNQEVEGVGIPTIQIQQDGHYLVISASDENGLKLVEYTLNKPKYRIDLTTHDISYYNAIEGLKVEQNSEGNIVKLEYRQLMNDKGENVVNLSVESKKNAVATFVGKCNNL